MDYSIYSFSLCIALPLMIFFGFYFLLAHTPDKAIFSNYIRSRRIMGIAMLLLSANYSVHFFYGIRFKNVNAAILMNLSTYFLCYWLFSSALTTLLDRFYITRRRLLTHICLWLLFSVLSAIVLLLLSDGIAPKDRTAYHGHMARDLRLDSCPQAHSGIPQGGKDFRRHSFRQHRGLHTLALRLHLLGRRVWRWLRPAHVPARQIHLCVDTFVDTFLHLPVPLLP